MLKWLTLSGLGRSAGEMLVVDGSVGEGGGQTLRVSVALSAVLGQPLKIYNIRLHRSPPGLRPQHLTAVKAVATLASADVSGLSIGSSELVFQPHTLGGGQLEFDAGTAGSTTLMLQSLMPAMCFAREPTNAVLKGGTNNPMAPPFEYLKWVLMPVLELMGVSCKLELRRRGFYPRGQGSISATCQPIEHLKSLQMKEWSAVESITGLSYSCLLPNHIPERIAKSASRVLSQNQYDNVDIGVEALQAVDARCSVGPGCGLILLAKLSRGGILSADALGERGKPAERVGEEAAKALLAEVERKAPVDRHLGDQLILWSSLAEGTSEYAVTELTSHTLTSAQLCASLTGAEIKIDGRLGERGRVVVKGIGLRNPRLHP